ncbi:MAG: hypothetical protein AB1468_03405 [Candidatus Micrarchaeota archaeon]
MKTALAIISLAMLLLLLSGCSAPGCIRTGELCAVAPCNCCSGECVPTTGGCVCRPTASSLWQRWGGTWQSAGGLVIIIAVFALISAWMVARAFQLRDLETLLKNEIYQAFVSAILFGAFVVFVPLLESVSQEFGAKVLGSQAGWSASNATGTWVITPNASAYTYRYRETGSGAGKAAGRWEEIQGGTIDCAYPCHFYLARAFLGRTYEQIAKQARASVKMYAELVFIETVHYGGYINILGVPFSLRFDIAPFAGYGVLYEQIGTAVDFMAKAMLSVKFQEQALLYIQNGVFPIFLVAGLILRTLWFTRKLGGLLLAIALGVYSIFPLLYVLGWYTIDVIPVMPQLSTTLIPSGTPQPKDLILFTHDLTPDSSKFSHVLFTQYDPVTGMPDSVGVLDTTAMLMLPALALPLLNIFITLAFIKALSPALGGDVEIAGLTRLL